MEYKPPWSAPSRVPPGVTLRRKIQGQLPRPVELTKANVSLGRNGDIVTSSATSSRISAMLSFKPEGDLFLIDLSSHGTYVNGERLKLKDPKKLANKMVIAFGQKPHTETFSVEGLKEPKRQKLDLYADLPVATVTQVESTDIKSPSSKTLKGDRSKVIFLDIDGVLRPVHGRENFMKNRSTIQIGGEKVGLLGGGEAKAGLDFWPEAMRALRYIVQTTDAMIVLSSDWRKDEELVDGVENSLREYDMPKLLGITPDHDASSSRDGVLKVLHTSFREKRCKEIRAWLKNHSEVKHFVSIDDADLSTSTKRIAPLTELGIALAYLPHAPQGDNPDIPLLNPASEFVRVEPTSGLNMHLAGLCVSFLQSKEVEMSEIVNAYTQSQIHAQNNKASS